MVEELRLVFDYLEQRFPGHRFAVIGSAVKDYAKANDIDILVPHSLEFKSMVAKLGVKYNGWDTLQGHLRRANIQVRGVRKKIQLLQVETVPTAQDHPNSALLSDGTVLKAGQFFDKSAHVSNFRVPKPTRRLL